MRYKDEPVSRAVTLGRGWLRAVLCALLMIFAGIVHSDVGIHPFGYITSMVVTIGLWLVLAPAIGAVAGGPSKKSGTKS